MSKINIEKMSSSRPWHINTLEIVPHSIHCAGGVVAECKMGSMLELTCDTVEANARLITTAVNEYAALKMCESALRRIMNANNSGNNGAYMGEAAVCRMFEDQANHALAEIDKARK